jgi:protein arginine N-methyltransferase 1
VEVPKPYGELVNPWDNNPFGQDLSPARQMVVNNFQRVRVSPDQLLTVAQLWTTLDYRSVDDYDARGHLDWRVERAGTGHGISVWFDTELADGIGFSNAPSAPEAIYASLFFPWTQPVSLVPGQAVSLVLEAKLVENDYVWRWTTRIEPPEGTDNSRIYFEQSQLTGAILSLRQLRRTAADYVPHLSEEGQLRQRTFDLMDGKASLEEIAHRLVKDFPERFPRWEQALSYASAISQDYSR